MCRLRTIALHKRRSAIGFSDCKRNFGVTLATAATGHEETFGVNQVRGEVGQKQTKVASALLARLFALMIP